MMSRSSRRFSFVLRFLNTVKQQEQQAEFWLQPVFVCNILLNNLKKARKLVNDSRHFLKNKKNKWEQNEFLSLNISLYSIHLIVNAHRNLTNEENKHCGISFKEIWCFSLCAALCTHLHQLMQLFCNFK